MASFVGEDNFESYTAGADLDGGSGGSGWSGNWSATASVVTVTDTESEIYIPTQGIDITTTSGEKTATRSFTAASDGSIYVAFMRKSGLTGADGGISILSGANWIGYISLNSDGNIKQYYGTGWATNNIQTYNADQWYVVNIEWNDATQDNKYRVRVHDGSGWGSWTAWNATLTATYTTVDTFRLSLNRTSVSRTAFFGPVSSTDFTTAPSDVANDTDLSTSIVSYWELEEASGTRVDSHGSNDLADNGTVTQGTGIQGNCADFTDSSSEYLSYASSATFVYDGASARSLSFWFYPHSVTGVNTVVSCWGGGSTQNWIVYTNGSNIVAGVESNGALITATSAATINTWHHVVLLMKASGSAELYVNGVSKGTGTPAGSAGANAPFYIGQNSSSNYYDGLVDEVGWWTKELSAGEISSLYNAGAGIPYDAGGAATFIPKVIMF